MPTLLLLNGFRFFFYSNENNEPAHVHVIKGNCYGKIWLEPSVNIVYLEGFNNKEAKDIEEIVFTYSERFKRTGMTTLINNFDAIEKLINQEKLKIVFVDFHPELDVMLIVLNTKAVLHQRLSSYPRLMAADIKNLLQYELIGNGTGIHWTLLDEDLSLKGFLQDELRNVVNGKQVAEA
ncbi:MAG TPA: DUF4160 domain-containing protein [Hanamia sp.]